MKQILLLTIAAVSLMAADATGKWTGTMTRTSPGAAQSPAVLILKQNGAKLTGTAGPDANDQDVIENGKAENGTLTFELKRDNSTMKFTLRLEGDDIKGDVEGERQGQKQTATLAVKREK